jgi:uncharacterized protein involved in exopolysaccharide biosynthesis
VDNDGEEEDSASLLGLATAVLRYRRWVLGAALACAILVGALTMMKSRKYTASGSFIPQSRGATSAFASAAGLVGLLPIGGDQSQAPQFYADLLISDELLRAMVDTAFEFRTPEGPVKETLLQVLQSGGSSLDIKRQNAIIALKSSVSVKTALKTGVVTFRVTTAYPELSALLANDLLERLNEFNMQARMARAATERKFTESRLATVQAELRDAENRLQEFMQNNQDFRNSSKLSVYQDQLQREVGTRQAVYTTLAQAYEQARIEEVRNTPVIMIVQHPRVPVLPDSRHVVLRVILAFLAAALVAAVVALVRDYFFTTDGAAEAPALEEFKAVVRETVRDVKHPIEALRRSDTSPHS